MGEPVRMLMKRSKRSCRSTLAESSPARTAAVPDLILVAEARLELATYGL